MQLMENVGIKLLAACSVCRGIQRASMVRTMGLCDVIQGVTAFFTHDGLRASRAVGAGL